MPQKNHVTDADRKFMARAAELAMRGKGRVEPNPPVGAVIVRDGRAIAEGFHERFGGPHAEINAIRAAGEGCRGATLYVTLSPCTGRNKKTPPCCDAVIEAGFRRVVIGTVDATQEPAVPRLSAAGIVVQTGVLAETCDGLVAPFLKLRRTGMPWLIAKWAMTADGKIAAATGDARWISSEESRSLVHQWRGIVDAILVGAGTARRDDPLLTCRAADGRNPLRVVIDSGASLASESRLVSSVREAALLIACAEGAPESDVARLTSAGCEVLRLGGVRGRVDTVALLHHLGDREMTNVLVEGGATLFADLFDRRLVDEARIFIAPKLVGGHAAPGPIAGAGIGVMDEAVALEGARWSTVGGDGLLQAAVRYPA